MTAVSPDPFRGTDRFTVVRRIGAGGMGVVYEAYDRARSMAVAVKTLPELDANALLLFKDEFRALADIAHLNLAAMYELFAEGDRWFFTMELVDGVDFLEYVRPSAGVRPGVPGSDAQVTALPTDALTTPPTPRSGGSGAPPDDARLHPGTLDVARLRKVLPQVAAGLTALHDAGKLHCDIKPSNVLVTPGGRVVILDFGVALSLHGPNRMTRRGASGTIAYMAPEQSAGQALDAAADSYALGVMLYEAAVGRRPFTGSTLDILRDKQTVTPPPIHAVAPAVPVEVSSLCARLLERRPEHRLRVREIVAALAGESAPVERSSVPAAAKLLIGRERHLELLRDAFAKVAAGRAMNVAVRGASGMGKSTLIGSFLDEIAAAENVVVVSGRCYENESVPYKAVDSLIDRLGRYLIEERASSGDTWLPPDAALLAQLFPVLGPVLSGARPDDVMEPSPGAQESRRRAFSALRALLAHIGKRRLVVLHVDDLHWGDVDSAVLLSHLLREPDPPRMLFLASYRSGAAESSPCVQALRQEGAFAHAPTLELDALSPDESARLAVHLMATGEQIGHGDVAEIARESSGNPYLIHELVERSRGAGRGALAAGQRVTLDGVLRERIDDLPADSRRLLEVAAVSGQPLLEDDAFTAAQLSARDPAILARLRKAHFVRTTGPAEQLAIDTYHDRIRETLLGTLTAAQRAGHHRSLALAFEGSGRADSETLARHWDGAGDLPRARRHYVQAAEAAAATLTFDLAARLFRRALDIGLADAAEHRTVQVRLGEALANVGRCHEAAIVYRAAAHDAGDAQARDLLRRAAYLYCVSGHADEGRALFEELFRGARLRLPATPAAAIRMLLWDRLVLSVRGHAPRALTTGEAGVADQNRIDLMWAAATGLMEFDPITGAALQGRGLRLSLAHGEPSRVARSLAMAAMTTVLSGGTPSRPRASALLERARELTNQVDQPHTRALIALVEGIVYWLIDRRWEAAEHAFDEAEDLLRTKLTGKTWELAVLHAHRVWMFYFRGHMRAAINYSGEMIREARERGDAYASVNLGIFAGGYARLLADDPAGAREHVQNVAADLPQRVTSIQRVMQIIMDCLIELYSGSPQAWDVLTRHWPVFEQTYQLRVEQMRIQMYHLRARCAMTALPTAADPAPLLREAERVAALLARERPQWAHAEARIVRAGLAAWHGDRASAADLLDAAARTLEAFDLGQTGMPARRQQGVLLGGERGRAMVDAADAALARQGVRAPERWSRTWVTIPIRPA